MPEQRFSVSLRALLSLTRHAGRVADLCRDCVQQQIREELASLSRAQDIEKYMAENARQSGAAPGEKCHG